MANTTKLALEASLKELLRTKPIDKITINDLTEHCGISRMAFYYHFKDIYDLGAVAALLPQAVRASAAVRVRAVSLVRFFITIGSFACRSAKILWFGAAAGR